MIPRTCLSLLAVVAVACGNVLPPTDDSVDAGVEASVDASVDAPPPPSAACVEPPGGLAAWWRGENNGDDVLGKHEAILGDGAAFAPATVGTGFSLDGVKNYLRVDHHGALYPAGSFAIEAWIIPAALGRGQTLLSAYECAGGCDGRSAVGLSLPAENNVELWVRDAADRGQSISTAARVAVGRAVHVVAVRDVDARTLALYLDGALAVSAPLTATGPLSAATSEDDPLVIGASIDYRMTAPAHQFAGVIDELSLYDAALTADDVTRLYAAGAMGKCAP